MRALTLLGGLCFATIVTAKNLGVIGSVGPIGEQSLLTFIEQELQQKQFENLEEPTQRRTAQYADRPGSYHLTPTNQTKRHTYIPQVILQNDIEDMDGHILWKKGTTINALHELPIYQPHWIFLDSDDINQLTWVKKHLQDNSKVILTKGSIKTATSFLNHDVYFDQDARFIHQLNIQHIPATVTRYQDVLLIKEIAIDADGSS
jgi:conjugal transfer pilus assembly protein TraW